MTEKVKICECCGGKIVTYRHTLNSGMVSAMLKLKENGGKAHLQTELDLTKNQYNNFQKLQYWGLVKKTMKSGEWELTGTGFLFLDKQITVPKSVYSFRGEAIDCQDQDKIKQVSASDIFPTAYEKKKDYIENAMSFIETNTLFDLSKVS